MAAPELRTRADVVRFLLARFKHRRFPARVHVSIIRRLVRHARLAPNGCIVWPLARDGNGYGKLNVRLLGEHFQFRVHRLAEWLGNDPEDVPKWMEVAHVECDNPPCFHPDHIGRQKRRDNRARSAERTNAKKRGEIPRECELRKAA